MNKNISLRVKNFCLVIMILSTQIFSQNRPRIIVETDLGGDQDDQASLIRFLLYSNEFDVQGIVLSRSNSQFQKDGAAKNPSGAKTTLEMANDYIDAYGKVLGNLQKHASGYPSATYLKSITKSGHEGSSARDLIINEMKRNDSRPLWYTNWGANDGSTSSLKIVLDDIKAGKISGLNYSAIMKILHYVELNTQNHIGNSHRAALSFYMDTFFPDMDGGRWYHRWSPLTSIEGWLRSNAKSDLANKLYTSGKEGDTPTWMHLIPNGINIVGKPNLGSWSGRYGWNNNLKMWWCDQRDNFGGSSNRDNTLKRFAPAIQNDFKARAKWADESDVSKGNHPPNPSINGDKGFSVLSIGAKAGQTIVLDASKSLNPDQNSLTFSWVYYKEISNLKGSITIENDKKDIASIKMPSDFSTGETIHCYLELSNTGSIPVTRYKRVEIKYDMNGTTNINSKISGLESSVLLTEQRDLRDLRGRRIKPPMETQFPALNTGNLL